MHDSDRAALDGGGAVRWAATPAPKARGYGPDPGCQPCPDCGGLECLCRPRFFAGQLLTEQDFNRLDHYITEKSKLHNRHLFGSGVVCGLVVTCAPCDELVEVSPGYALSPCGEDIVVCKPDSVDVCALIARCRDDVGPDCRPYSGRDPCNEVEEEWVLALRYAETPSAPRTPLVGPASCGCGCGGTGKGCGCGSGGGCGCGGHAAGGRNHNGGAYRTETATAQLPRLRRGAPPTCEPTVTCEAYRYEVFRKPEPAPRDPIHPQGDPGTVVLGSLAGLFERLEGEMAARIACCLRDLEAALPRAPGTFASITLADRQAWFRWCCAVRSSLSAYFGRIGGTDCETLDRIAAVRCPDPELPLDDFRVALARSVLALLGPTLEAMLHCICTNVLPPCPAPDDPRVPLAVVTIRRRDCHIVKVCNWTPLRRHVVTLPTLGYWLGWFPFGRILREFMEQLCCRSFDFGDLGQDRRPEGVAAATGGSVPADPGPLDAPAGVDFRFDPVAHPIFAAALARQISDPDAVGGATLTQADLFDLVLRRPSYLLPDGLDAEDAEQVTNRLAGSALVKALGGVARSTEGLVPPGLGGILRPEDGAQKPPAPADLAELRRVLDRQAEEIAALTARMDAGGKAAVGAAAPSRRRRTPRPKDQ